MKLRSDDPEACPICHKDLRPAVPSLVLSQWEPGSGQEEAELVQMFCNDEHLVLWLTVSREEQQGIAEQN